MTSAYRREHITSAGDDELDLLTPAALLNISAAVTAFQAIYPTPAASGGETLALQRAMARYLIDSGKASAAGVLV